MYSTTILLPTRNRYKFLSRLIPFLAKENHGFDARIFVLDGSTDDECAQKSEKLCSGYGIEFKHFDSGLSYTERISLALQAVKTNTVSLMDDEDIVSIRGMMKCVDFLENNNDYSVANGKYKYFDVSKNKLRYGPTYTSKSIEQDSQLERIWAGASNSDGSIFLAVHRTENLNTIFKEIASSNISFEDPASYELLLMFISLTFGKRKILNCFYKGRGDWVRQQNTIINYKRLMMGSIDSYLSFAEIHRRNKDILLKYLKDAGNENIDEILDCIFALYFLYRPEFISRNDRTLNQLIKTIQQPLKDN